MTASDFNGGPRSVVADSEPGRDEARPSRKTPAHQPVHDVFNRASIIFLTVCSQDRRPLFDKPDIHDLLKMA